MSPELVITILIRCLVLGGGEARADRGQEDEGEGGGDLGEDGIKDGQVIGSDHCGYFSPFCCRGCRGGHGL